MPFTRRRALVLSKHGCAAGGGGGLYKLSNKA
jgi:hypothetical protein